MKNTIFISFLLLAAGSSSAQTKMIAHRSHSGKNHTFNANVNGNLGLSIPPEINTYKANKPVVYKTDTASKPKTPAKKDTSVITPKRHTPKSWTRTPAKTEVPNIDKKTPKKKFTPKN